MSFGSTTEDNSGVRKGYDRGPVEEDRKTEAELRGTMQDIAKAKTAMGDMSTVQGFYEEVQFLKSMMDDVNEQHNRTIGLYETLRGEFDQFKKQRAIELQSWLAKGGSTTPEDN
jgi:hypothetical protein